MMNPFSWLQMTNMISYQGLARTFPRPARPDRAGNIAVHTIHGSAYPV